MHEHTQKQKELSSASSPMPSKCSTVMHLFPRLLRETIRQARLMGVPGLLSAGGAHLAHLRLVDDACGGQRLQQPQQVAGAGLRGREGLST